VTQEKPHEKPVFKYFELLDNIIEETTQLTTSNEGSCHNSIP